MGQKFAAFAAIAGVLAIAAGSASAAGWLPPVDVSPTAQSVSHLDNLSLQDVGVDEDGNAVAVWVQPAGGGGKIVRSATRPVGGAWSSPTVISNLDEQPLGLEVAVGPDGDAALVWIGYGSQGQVVRAATRPGGGGWSAPVALSDPGTEEAVQPDVAIDSQGTATAIWIGGEGWEEGVVETASHPAGGEWSEPVELSDESRAARSPQVVVDPQDEATAVWILNTGSRDDGVVQSTTRPAGGEWETTAADVSGANGLASLPRVAVDAQGDATVVWQQQNIAAPSGFRIFVQTAHRVDGTWSAPLSISREDWISTKPEVTVDPQGKATAIWTGGQPGTATRYLQVRSRDAGGSWDGPVDLVTKNGLVEPGETDFGLAADPEGNVTAVWTAWSVPTYVVRSARRVAGGAWSTPVTVSSPSGYSMWPRLAMDPQGHATVVWTGLQGSTHAVRSRVFDPVAPELLDLEVPASAQAGEPVEMSVDPFDVWSPVASSWSFGDGGTGTGTAVSHCYSSPGEFEVRVTGTDGAANATSATQTISIEPDPALVPGSDPCREGEPPDDDDPPKDPGLPGPGDRPSPDPEPRATAPVVSDLGQSSSRWRLPGTRSRSRLPVGTSFRFRLDRPALARLAFSRVGPNRTSRARTLKIPGEAGANTYRFKGRIREGTLARGHYRLLVTALADGLASAPISIEFTIVR